MIISFLCLFLCRGSDRIYRYWRYGPSGTRQHSHCLAEGLPIEAERLPAEAQGIQAERVGAETEVNLQFIKEDIDRKFRENDRSWDWSRINFTQQNCLQPNPKLSLIITH